MPFQEVTGLVLPSHDLMTPNPSSCMPRKEQEVEWGLTHLAAPESPLLTHGMGSIFLHQMGKGVELERCSSHTHLADARSMHYDACDDYSYLCTRMCYVTA